MRECAGDTLRKKGPSYVKCTQPWSKNIDVEQRKFTVTFRNVTMRAPNDLSCRSAALYLLQTHNMHFR